VSPCQRRAASGCRRCTCRDSPTRSWAHAGSVQELQTRSPGGRWSPQALVQRDRVPSLGRQRVLEREDAPAGALRQLVADGVQRRLPADLRAMLPTSAEGEPQVSACRACAFWTSRRTSAACPCFCGCERTLCLCNSWRQGCDAAVYDARGPPLPPRQGLWCRAAGRHAAPGRGRRRNTRRPRRPRSAVCAQGGPSPVAACAASSRRSHTGRAQAGAAAASRRSPACRSSSSTPPRTTGAAACAFRARPFQRSATPGSGTTRTATATASAAPLPRCQRSADTGSPRATATRQVLAAGVIIGKPALELHDAAWEVRPRHTHT